MEKGYRLRKKELTEVGPGGSEKDLCNGKKRWTGSAGHQSARSYDGVAGTDQGRQYPAIDQRTGSRIGYSKRAIRFHYQEFDRRSVLEIHAATQIPAVQPNQYSQFRKR